MVLLSVRVFSSVYSSRWLAIVHPVATSVTVKVQTEWCGREGQVVLCNECDVAPVVGFAAAADVAVSAAVDAVFIIMMTYDHVTAGQQCVVVHLDFLPFDWIVALF